MSYEFTGRASIACRRLGGNGRIRVVLPDVRTNCLFVCDVVRTYHLHGARLSWRTRYVIQLGREMTEIGKTLTCYREEEDVIGFLSVICRHQS